MPHNWSHIQNCKVNVDINLLQLLLTDLFIEFKTDT